jgi:aspartate aminotransferase-like enzyme
MEHNRNTTIAQFVADRNEDKKIFTAGPASLVDENLYGLMSCFGRGDQEYLNMEDQVLSDLKNMTGHTQIARLQGSASLALEIMVLNFLFGKVLVVNTGYYSERMVRLSEDAKALKNITAVTSVDWREISEVSGQYDWVVACPTETSCGLKLPIEDLYNLAKKCGSQLMLDATASIGLEGKHELADVLAYSSCKGLFGLTGAAFIAFNELPCSSVPSFYLDLASHLQRKMTGPYHAIASLAGVLSDHDAFREAVVVNKARYLKVMEAYLTLPATHQPLLCTKVSCEVFSSDPKAILYKPRTTDPGSVVCHLGEVHLKRDAKGEILNALEYLS